LIWFSSLSFIIRKSAKFISPSKQVLINKVSALILLFFGIRLVFSVL
jgi:arginine exporter protein ArgO